MEQEVNVAYDDTLRLSAGKRFVNYLIDFIVNYIIAIILGIIFGLLAAAGVEGPLEWYLSLGVVSNLLVSIFLFISYYFIMEVTTQRTVGKLITGSVVVMEDGTEPPANVLMLRTLCRLIPFEPFSFFGSEARGWHDTMTETYVVDRKRLKELQNLKRSFDEIGTTQY